MQRLSNWISEHRAELLGTLGPPIFALLVALAAKVCDVRFGLYVWLEFATLPGIAVAAAVAYWVSCRVADREGQPWAWLSFWLVSASYVGSAALLFLLGPSWNK